MLMSFMIPVRPTAWQRAGKHGKVHFTPASTAKFENTVRLYANQAMAGKAIFDEPIDVTINFVYALPKSAPREHKENVAKGIYYGKTSRPDIDNLIKAVLDGMNGVVYRDDACVWCITAMKTLHSKDEVRVTISTSGNTVKTSFNEEDEDE